MTFEKAFEKKYQQLLKDLTGESDRAVVIIAAAYVDEIVGEMLQTVMVASPTASDNLFDGPNAPLSNLSNRIDFSFRLGLISASASRSLHILRRIRNSFAHNISGCSFAETNVANRVEELYKLHKIDQKHTDLQEIYGESTKAKFLMSITLLVGVLQEKQHSVKTIAQQGEEWPYQWLLGI
jgi:hypothetical protein